MLLIPLFTGLFLTNSSTELSREHYLCSTTDAHGTTDTTQRDALTQQVFNHSALRFRNEVVFGRGPKLALASFTLMILFAVAGMAIFLVPL